MQIECTNRIIKRLMDVNTNMRRETRVRALESVINGGTASNLTEPIEQNLYMALRRYVLGTLRTMGPEDFDTCVAMPTIVKENETLSNYIKSLNLNEETLKKINTELSSLKIEPITFKKDSLCITGEPELSNDFIGKGIKFGIYEEDQNGIVVKNDNSIEAVVNYTEYITKTKAAQRMNGKVCVIGDKLLLFTYLLSLNPNVTDITVIEPEKENKDFSKIRAFFKDSLNINVNIINEPIDKFFEDNKDNIDYVWVDDYKNVEDGFIKYLEIAKYIKKYQNIKFKFWLETSILITVRVNILQYLSAKIGTPERLRQFKVLAGDAFDALEREDLTIKIPKHIDYCLTDDFAKNIILASV
ncbi:MAG: hypothetical protein Q4P22_06575 [Eubacteriales bacterium]|nr:hypothetical protein [Eubacteriales bacterium]